MIREIREPGTSSHLPVLAWAQLEVQRHGWGGSVLEFGAGRHSTSFLADLERHGFPTASVEADPEWRAWVGERFPDHLVVDRWDGEWYDVVLIDCGNGADWVAERAATLKAVRGHCAIALVHDWHIGHGHRDNLVASFVHHGWYAPEGGTMHTAICSDLVWIESATIPGGYIYTSWDDAPGDWKWDGWPN